MSMTDQYYSRLLAIARQNKNIKFIKDIKNNTIETIMNDGSTQHYDWEDVFSYEKVLNEQTKAVETVRHPVQG